MKLFEMRPSRLMKGAPRGAARADRLAALVGAFESKRLLVIGDIVADEFIYGEVARVSREAPVLILRYDATEILTGGAGNAANNAASLGAMVRLVGLIGGADDGSARRLVESLHARVESAGLVSPRGYCTPVKTRILAGGIHSAKQQVVRIDRDGRYKADTAARETLMKRIVTAIARCDAVLISDYGSGLVTPALVRRVRQAIRSSPRPMPVLLDSRYHLLSYRGLTMCTPNESEVEQMLGIRIGEGRAALERAGRAILRRTRVRAALVTRGSRGMALFEPDRPTVHIPIYGSDEVTDATGAGDTVIATCALALAAGASFDEAARLANYAGGLVVMKRGTATVTAKELAEAVTTDRTSASNGR